MWKKKIRFFFIIGQSWMPSLKCKSWTDFRTYLSTYLVIKGPTNQLKKIVKSQGSNGNSPLTLKSANNALMKLYSECYTSTGVAVKYQGYVFKWAHLNSRIFKTRFSIIFTKLLLLQWPDWTMTHKICEPKSFMAVLKLSYFKYLK